MSLEYTCYTALRQRPLVQEIESQLARWQIVVQNPNSRRRISATTRLPAFSYVWGWKFRAKAAGAAAAILECDEAALAGLTKYNVVGCCELSAESFQADPEQLEFLGAKRDREYLATAKCRYDTRTSAGGNAIAWELQKAICMALAKLDGGLLEEPQTGQFKLVKARTA